MSHPKPTPSRAAGAPQGPLTRTHFTSLHLSGLVLFLARDPLCLHWGPKPVSSDCLSSSTTLVDLRLLLPAWSPSPHSFVRRSFRFTLQQLRYHFFLYRLSVSLWCPLSLEHLRLVLVYYQLSRTFSVPSFSSPACQTKRR